jgi:hypothetical protein
MLPVGQAHAQADQDKAAARSLATQGAESFTAGRFEEAIDLVSRAEALVHAPTHLLLIARAQKQLGRLVAAKETYLKVAREELPAAAPPAFKKAQQDAREELAAIDPKIASLRLTIEGAAGRKISVTLDGQPVADALLGVHRPVDPGNHAIVASAPGQSPIEQQVTLGEGERKDLTIPIPAVQAAPVAPLSTAPALGVGAGTTSPDAGGGSKSGLMLGLGIGGAAVGLGGVVLGAVFLAKGFSTQQDADDLNNRLACEAKRTCTADEREKISSLDSDAASQKTVGTIVLTGGGLLLAGGVTLTVLELTSKPAPKSTAWVAPYVTPTGLGVHGAF